MTTQKTHVQYTAEGSVVKLYARATGAATSALTGFKGKGIATLLRTGVGTYTATLQDKYAGLLMFSGAIISTTTAADWEFTVASETVASTKTVLFTLFKDGAASDMAVTEKMLLEITLSNTVAKPAGF